MRARPRGFTLIEILIVVMIAGILMAVTLPRIGTTLNDIAVHSAKQEVVAMLARARATAIQTGRPARFVRQGNVIQVFVETESGGEALVQAEDLARTQSVTVNATRDTVRFDPRGLVTDNGTGLHVTITRAAALDSVCVLGYGTISQRCTLAN